MNHPGQFSFGTTFINWSIFIRPQQDKIASAVDTQIDDGLMQTGMVRSAGPQAAPNPALAALPGGNTTYVENGTNQYTICKQL